MFDGVVGHLRIVVGMMYGTDDDYDGEYDFFLKKKKYGNNLMKMKHEFDEIVVLPSVARKTITLQIIHQTPNLKTQNDTARIFTVKVLVIQLMIIGMIEIIILLTSSIITIIYIDIMYISYIQHNNISLCIKNKNEKYHYDSNNEHNNNDCDKY